MSFHSVEWEAFFLQALLLAQLQHQLELLLLRLPRQSHLKQMEIQTEIQTKIQTKIKIKTIPLPMKCLETILPL